MSTQDILNIILIIGIISFTVCVATVTYFFIVTLKAVKNLAEQVSSTTEGLRSGLGVKMLTVFPSIFIALLSKFIKRGRWI